MSIKEGTSVQSKSCEEQSPKSTFFDELLLGVSYNPSIDGSSQFNEHMATILLGMGLEKDEVLLFKNHNIGLEKFLDLTDEDLDYIGIKDRDKQNMLLNGIHNFKSNKAEKEQKKKKEILVEFSNNNAITMLTNTSSHLGTLCKTTPYIQQRLRHVHLDQYLNDSVSAKHTMVIVAEKGIQQAEQLCKQLQCLQWDIEKLHIQLEGRKKRSRNTKLLAVLATTTTLLTIVLWRLPKVMSFQTNL